MSAALIATAGPPILPSPSPTRVQPNAASFSIRAILSLVFSLLKHGESLAYAFRDQTTSWPAHLGEPGFGLTGRLFGTDDPWVIATCILRGSMRSLALHRRLWRRGNRGLEMPLPAQRRARPPRSRHDAQPSAAADPPVRTPARPKWWRNYALDYLPSEAEVAEEARRRPVGALLADICLDFGMSMPVASELWRALYQPIARFGGDTFRLLQVIARRRTDAELGRTPCCAVPLAAPSHDPGAAEQADPAAAPLPQAPGAIGLIAAPCPALSVTPMPIETGLPMPWPVFPPPKQEIAATGPP